MATERRPYAAVTALVVAVTMLTLGLHSSARGSEHRAVARTASTTSKPNIVEVLADDMRVSDLRYMPSLRRLVAHNGIYMANSFSSYPLCCPARASFYTGLLPHNHHVYTVNKPYAYGAFDDRRTIATSLKSAGYTTGFTGKYLNGYGGMTALAPKLRWRAKHPGAPASKASRVRSERYVPAGWDDWRAGLQQSTCHCGGEYSYFHYAYTDNGRPKGAGGGAYSSDFITKQAIAQTKRFHVHRRRTGKPFFMSVNYVAPHYGDGTRANPGGYHYTVRSGGRVHRRYQPTPAAPRWAFKVPLIKHIRRGAGVLPGGTTEPGVGDKPGRWASAKELSRADDRAVRIDTQRRAAAIYVMDRDIKKLINHLKSEHEWDRTVFVFWSDNGYFQGEHHRPKGKVLGYEPSLRVPMLFTGPGMRGGAHTGTFGGQDRFDPIDVVDLTQTLLAVGGARPPHSPDGESRLPLLLGPDTGWTTAVPYESVGSNPARAGNHHHDPAFARRRGGIRDPRTAVGVRTGRYIYIRYVDGETEIYDLWNDPLEWSNLGRDRTWLRDNAAVVGELDQVWHQQYACTGGSTCDATLPPGLAVSAAVDRTQTIRYQDALQRTYGTWR